MKKSEPGSSEQHYLEERVVRALPELRLSRLFFPHQQVAITAQFVLFDELRELLLIADRGVAMTKLGWWYEEWKRLLGQQPRHPVTRQLHSAFSHHPALDASLQVLAAMIGGPAAQSTRELDQWLTGLASPLAALDGSGESGAAAWRQIWLVSWIADFSALAAAGRVPWSIDLAARTQLLREEVAQPQHRAASCDCLWQELAGDAPAAAGHSGVYLQLRKATALRVARGLAPAGRWRQLWLAWNATRKSRQLAAAARSKQQ